MQLHAQALCAISPRKGGPQGTLDFFLLNFWLPIDSGQGGAIVFSCIPVPPFSLPALTNDSKLTLAQLSLLTLSGSQTQTSRQSVEDLREAVQVDGVFGDGSVCLCVKLSKSKFDYY